MRKLLWFALGFGLACGYGAYLAPESLTLPMIIAAVIGVFAAVKSRKLGPVVLLCLGCVLGLCWFGAYERFYLQSAISADGTEVTGTVTVSDYSYETDYGVAADGILELEGKAYQIRIYVNEETALSPGDRVTGTFRLRYTPGGLEEATYHGGNGMFLLGYPKGEVEITEGNSDGFLPAVLARTVKDRLRELLPSDVFAFAQALLLGDSTELSYEVDTAFQLSGIRHIIAVSGLHVMILYSLLSAVTFRNKWLTALLCLPLLVLFAAMAGFTPSVVRACIMVGLMILAQIFRREYDPPTSLAFAALVMLVLNPLVVTSVSFQLSVGCVAGIQLFSGQLNDWHLGKLGAGKGRGLRMLLKRWLASSVSVTLGAMSLTTPLSAYYFGAVSLIGVVTNLLTLWVVNFVFNGLIVISSVSWLSMEIALWLAPVVIWPIRFVLKIADILGSFPLAAVYTASPYIVIWLVFVYLLLAVFLLSRRKRPWILTCCGTLGLCLALLASWAEPMLDGVRVTMLDVGQGQSILLQSQGKTFLVDCGGDSGEDAADAVAETLLSMGITRLDGIIITHGDRDHAGGLPNLLTRIETDMLFLPSSVESAPDNAFLVEQDEILTYGNTEIRIFGPIGGENHNENSLCVLFQTENCAILITGDRSSLGELVLVHDYDLPDVDLLVAGHHGSQNSTSELLLETVKPEVVFISVGKDNPYGHPAQALLNRLEEFGCRVYRTDLNGTLIFRR